MKTPREILLERHQAAAPRLDAVRRDVLAELKSVETKEQNYLVPLVAWLLRCPNVCWRELFLPCRRVWTGLAAVWLLVFVVNFSQRDPVSSVTGRAAHSPAVMMSWQVQQRWMNELLADRSMQLEADPPKLFLPKPRTEKNDVMTA